jgi:hypothetical protein
MYACSRDDIRWESTREMFSKEHEKQTGTELVRFQVHMAVSINVIVFCDIMPCSLKGHRHFEMHTVSIIALMMKALYTSETSVYFQETIQCYIPEGCHL